MNKDKISTGELAAMIATDLTCSVREADDFMRALIHILEEQLLASDSVKIKGLGTFKLQWNAPRKSVDVNTAEEIVIEGYYKVSFAPESELKDLVNEPYAHLMPVVLSTSEEDEVLMTPEKTSDPDEDLQEEQIADTVDPVKLDEAMKAITEQAMEIKDILSEMSMMGVSSTKTQQPSMVSEEVKKEKKEIPVAVASTPVISPVSAPTPPAPTSVAPPVTPPIVPPPAPPVSDVTQNQQVKLSKEPLKEKPIVKKESVIKDSIPDRIQHSSSSHHSHSSHYSRRRSSRRRSVSNGLWLLLVGIIAGGIITYILSSTGVLPELGLFSGKSKYIEVVPITNAAALTENITIADSLEMDSTQATISNNQSTVDSMQTLFDTPRIYTEFIGTEEVREGSRMTRISERHYGAKEFWVYIYEANRDMLKYPDDIKMGMELKIPKVDPRLLDKTNPRSIEYALKLHDEYLKK